MIPDLEQRMLREPPNRVLDASVPFFTDYGYRSPDLAIKALSHSIEVSDVPHFIVVMGKPKSGKMHIVWDIANRLYYQNPEKRTEGVIQKLLREQGRQTPFYTVLWGNCFSLAKLHNSVEKNKIYGQFGPNDIASVTREFESMSAWMLDRTRRKRAVIFLKVPAVTGASADQEFVGVDRAYSALQNIAQRKGPFANYEYKTFWFAEVAEQDVYKHGHEVRTDLEKVMLNGEEIAARLKSYGENIYTKGGSLSAEDSLALQDYVSESANPAVTEEITQLNINLAVELAERGRLRFKPDSYFLDPESQLYRFVDDTQELLATALTLRYVLEENFGISKRVFLGKSRMLKEISLDLNVDLQNAVLIHPSYGPKVLRGIRNK